jgi:hypothetical protein
MRALLLLVCLLPTAVPAQGSPEGLAGIAFAPVDWAVKVQQGGQSAHELVGEAPAHVRFGPPGEVEFSLPEGSARCHFTASGGGFLWALHLDCGGERLERQWTWLRTGAVWTDLVDLSHGELARLPGDATPSEEAVHEAPRSGARPSTPGPASEGHRGAGIGPRELGSSAQGRRRPKEGTLDLGSLAGRWRSAKGISLEIAPGDWVSLDGHRSPAALLRCVHVQLEEAPRVPCLTFKDTDGRAAVFALLADYALVEGTLGPQVAPALPAFSGWRGGRIFRREGAASTQHQVSELP